MPWVFVLIWSTGFIVARYGMAHAPPLSFLSMRFALSIVCFAAWLGWSRPPWPRRRSQLAHLAMVGLMMQAGYLGGVWSAVKLGAGAGTVALLVGLQPVLTALWLTGVGQDATQRVLVRTTPRQWAGVLLGLAGVTLVLWPKLGAGELTATNLSLALLALLSITAGTLYQKRFVGPCDVRCASLIQLLAALAVCAPLALLEAGAMQFEPQLIGALAWSVLGLTLGGSSLLYLLIQRGAATEVSSLMYLVPPCTALLGWLLFDEVFTPLMLLGLAMAAAGVAWVSGRPGAAPSA